MRHKTKKLVESGNIFAWKYGLIARIMRWWMASLELNLIFRITCRLFCSKIITTMTYVFRSTCQSCYSTPFFHTVLVFSSDSDTDFCDSDACAVHTRIVSLSRKPFSWLASNCTAAAMGRIQLYLVRWVRHINEINRQNAFTFIPIEINWLIQN